MKQDLKELCSVLCSHFETPLRQGRTNTLLQHSICPPQLCLQAVVSSSHPSSRFQDGHFPTRFFTRSHSFPPSDPHPYFCSPQGVPPPCLAPSQNSTPLTSPTAEHPTTSASWAPALPGLPGSYPSRIQSFPKRAPHPRPSHPSTPGCSHTTPHAPSSARPRHCYTPTLAFRTRPSALRSAPPMPGVHLPLTRKWHPTASSPGRRSSRIRSAPCAIRSAAHPTLAMAGCALRPLPIGWLMADKIPRESDSIAELSVRPRGVDKAVLSLFNWAVKISLSGRKAGLRAPAELW